MTTSLADYFFVIPHLRGQNPEWSPRELLAEIENRRGSHLSDSERAQLEALMESQQPGGPEHGASSPTKNEIEEA